MASQTLIFWAQYTANKAGKIDLAPTIDITSVRLGDGVQAAVVTGGSMAQVTVPNKRGLYFYRLTGADPRTYAYCCAGVTADATVDLQNPPAVWMEFSPAAQVALTDNAPGAGAGLPSADDVSAALGAATNAWTGTGDAVNAANAATAEAINAATQAQTAAGYAASAAASAAAALAAAQTALDRLGAFTGTGLNTVLGFLRALAARAAGLTPTDLSAGTTFNNASHSLEQLTQNVAAGGVGAPTQQKIEFTNQTVNRS